LFQDKNSVNGKNFKKNYLFQGRSNEIFWFSLKKDVLKLSILDEGSENVKSYQVPNNQLYDHIVKGNSYNEGNPLSG